MSSSASEAPKPPADVFISYARLDDEPPPDTKRIVGWVTFFWNNLRWELTNAGAGEATLWLDRYEIEPAERFSDVIDRALQKARVIVPVVSPNWVRRDWCLQEVVRFCEVHGAASDENIALVIKREVPSDDLPEPLRGREGYRFFEREQTGQIREFYWRGLQDRQAYLALIKRMAEWIAERLQIERRNSAPSPAPSKPAARTVFVSVSEELSDARQRLVNDLEGAGLKALPKANELAGDPEEAAQAVRAMLDAAELCVHLLGDPADAGPESATSLQLRIARERMAEPGAKFARVLWAPKWLPNRPPDQKRDPFEVIKQFGEDPSTASVYGEEVTNLSQWIRARLGVNTPAADPPGVIVAAAVASDEELASAAANLFQRENLQVTALFAGDPAPAAGPRKHAAALIPWGAASKPELDRLLDTLLPVAAQLIVLRLPGGDEAAKRRFFRQGVILQALPALPSERSDARKLLADLDIGAAS